MTHNCCASLAFLALPECEFGIPIWHDQLGLTPLLDPADGHAENEGCSYHFSGGCMPDPREESFGDILQRVNRDDLGAWDELIERVYVELRRLAGGHWRRRFWGQQGDLTLQPSALVN